ncbi:MAG: SDR family NAD(P)-dependent oxidoreductase [Acidimicrobiales bacterium]|nr:SDR family NAD(P)-dependent oxidoreductase [Acidimicrobiales bacterium]
MSTRFEGKVVIVTGAASGFGEAIANKFAHEGAKVVVADLDEAGAERVAAGLHDAVSLAADVTTESGNKPSPPRRSRPTAR